MLAPYCAIWSVGRAALNQFGVDQGSASKDSDAGFRLTKTLKVALSWTLLPASARSDSQLGVPVSRDPSRLRKTHMAALCLQPSVRRDQVAHQGLQNSLGMRRGLHLQIRLQQHVHHGPDLVR